MKSVTKNSRPTFSRYCPFYRCVSAFLVLLLQKLFNLRRLLGYTHVGIPIDAFKAQICRIHRIKRLEGLIKPFAFLTFSFPSSS